MRRRFTLVTAIALLGSLSLVGQASANSVTLSPEFTLSGNNVTVSGTASFPAITTPQSVGGTKTAFQGANGTPVAQAAGIDLAQNGGQIVPINGGLRFIWNVTNMVDPQVGVPPDVVRYTWAFAIEKPDGTQTTYQLQAKRTNFTSLTWAEDPIGHLQNHYNNRPWFQLRGACVDQYPGDGIATPVAGCAHLAFLPGTFDYANRQVRMDLMFRQRDTKGRIVADEFAPGATLNAFNSASMSISGCFQAVVSSTATCNYINAWNPYYIGGRVQLGVGPATADPASVTYGAPVTLNNGAFTGTLTTSATNNTVFARACNGATCGYTSLRVR
ncbi:MAG TPA: hypothetical protein VM638_03670 [Actinomycetota bacterium]|nr:hypothetical protein [Actinomycetota bacterium]